MASGCSLGSLQCLVANMGHVGAHYWPQIVSRFQDTLDLKGGGESVRLEQGKITLLTPRHRHVVDIPATSA